MTCSELPGGSISVAQRAARAARASTVEPTGRGCAGQTGGVAAVGRPGHGAVRTGPQTKRAPRDRIKKHCIKRPGCRKDRKGAQRPSQAASRRMGAGWLDGSMARWLDADRWATDDRLSCPRSAIHRHPRGRARAVSTSEAHGTPPTLRGGQRASAQSCGCECESESVQYYLVVVRAQGPTFHSAPKGPLPMSAAPGQRDPLPPPLDSI